jgi:hypothetical protein
VKAQLDGLREQIETFVTKERQTALDEIGQRIASIEGLLSSAVLPLCLSISDPAVMKPCNWSEQQA